MDGAHGFGHIPFRLDELGCDYYGTSGHKWLYAPLGTGLLFVRRERIHDLWPLMACFQEEYREDIRKFEWLGSRSPAHHNAIADALDFQKRLGVARKAARLHYLKRRWVDRLDAQERVRIVTDPTRGRSCGIASFHVEDLESKRLADQLVEFVES